MKFKNPSITVIYIAGNGHSGSTLLDIIIGSRPGFFSAGELVFITRQSIKEEYCSCGQMISRCHIWSKIWKLWDEKREISYAEYQTLRMRYDRNKSLITTMKNQWFPGKPFLKYCQATSHLLESIHEVTGANYIIDSSKVATRIAVLNRITNLKVIHLCRDFKGVLNSAKKAYKKDILAGIEDDINIRGTSRTLFDWILNNFLVELYCLFVQSKKLKYRNYIKQPDLLIEFSPNLMGFGDNLFNADHMLAGNAIRLKKSIKIDPKLGFSYNRLTRNQLRFSNLIDRLFWFWV